MNIEELLRTSSADIASGVVAPDVEPTAIRGAARRRTRLRTATVGSAVVAVALVAALVVARPGDRDADPAPVPTPTPTPKHTHLKVDSAPVWGDSEGVHVGDRTYPLAVGVRLETLAATANGVAYGDTGGRVWFQPRRGEAVEIGRADRRSLAAGPASTKAVWAEGRELVVFDTQRLEEVGRARAPGRLQTDSTINGPHAWNPSPFLHVTDDRVILSASGGDVDAWTYRIEQQAFEPLTRRPRESPGPVRHLQHIDHAPGINASSLIVFPRDPKGGFGHTVTFADDAGRKISSFRHADRTGLFNATGTRFATVVHHPGERTHVAVVDPGSGRSRRLTEESDRYPIVAWGRGEILMVWRIRIDGPRDDDQLMACDVRRATCHDLPFSGRFPVIPVG